MKNYLGFYIFLVFLAAAVPYAWMGLNAWRKRPAVAVTPFAWLMLSMSVWALCYGLEVFLPAERQKLRALNIEYIGVVSTPVFLFFFALEFTGKSHWISSMRARALFWALPLLTLIFIWTNSSHQMLWEVKGVMQSSQITLLDIEYKSLFWVFTFYSFLLIIAAMLLLLTEMFQRPGEYRILVNLIGLGILAPLTVNLLAALRVNFLSHLDITTIAALPVSLGFFWAITRRYRLLELLPIEYVSVLKTMTDGVIILDAQRRVVYLNPVVERLFKRSESESIGQPLNYVSSIYGEKLANLIGVNQRVELSFVENGQERFFEVTTSPVQASYQKAGDQHNMIVLHDITHLKLAENALSRRESIMSALSAAAGQLLKEASWEYKIPSVLEKIGRAAGVSRVWVAMNYTDHNGHIYSSLCYEWSRDDAEPQIENKQLRHIPLRKAGMGRWEALLSAGESIFGLVKDLPENERAFLQSLGSLSIAVVPVFVKTYWWGFIMFEECRHERQWTSTDIEALSIAANMFGSAEERARTEQKLIRRQQLLDALHEIVLVSLQSEDLMIMSQKLAQKFAALIHADRCAILLWEESSRQEILLAVFHRGKQPTTRPQTFSPAAYSLTEMALNRGHALVLEEVTPSFYAEQNLVETFPAKSLLALPLLAGRKKIGSVQLSFENQHRFSAEEISICEQASNLTALALEKFQTVEEAQKRAHTSEMLRQASVAITSTLETDEAVARILEQLKQVVPYDSASVQILHGNHLEIIGGSGFPNLKDVVGMKFPVPGDNPNTQVIKTGEPYLLAEVGEVYAAFREPPHNHIRSWLGVPLIFQQRVIGLLAIDSGSPHRFKEEDINLAVMFANQVAVTLENARIFKQTQDQAITDPLTGVYNRRGMFQVGDFELLRARRLNRFFSLLIFDIDHFKRVNDQYGHLAGDQVLRGLAERVHANLRSMDLICRYGGEEFVVFLPDAQIDSALMIAERMRQSVMKEPFATDAGLLPVTISIGAAQATEHDSLTSLIERADRGLYAAKRAGRNRVMLGDEI